MSSFTKKLAPSWYTLEVEQDPKPEFLLRPLTPLQTVDLKHEVYIAPSDAYQISARGVQSALQAAVVGWRNVTEEDGQQAEFSTRRVFDLPASWLDKLATEIANRAVLSESERKNSSSPSTAQ